MALLVANGSLSPVYILTTPMLGYITYVLYRRRLAYPPVAQSVLAEFDAEGRVPCPVCAEKVMAAATVCHFCNSPIFSRDKGQNALLRVFWFVVTFLVFSYLIHEYAWYQANSDLQRIEAQMHLPSPNPFSRGSG